MTYFCPTKCTDTHWYIVINSHIYSSNAGISNLLLKMLQSSLLCNLGIIVLISYEHMILTRYKSDDFNAKFNKMIGNVSNRLSW